MRTVTFTALAVIVAGLLMFSWGSQPINQLRDDQEVECGFTSDFLAYLKKNNAKSYDRLVRNDVRCSGFGGKTTSSDTPKKVPIVFIHGNSDVGFGRGTQDGYKEWQTGFRSLATFLMTQGYTKTELYTFTWGPADDTQAQNNYHSEANVMLVAEFMTAVRKYLNVSQIDVISHSMGVTLGRMVAKGGSSQDHATGPYQVAGQSSYIRNFIGLAGANLGLVGCVSATVFPTCSTVDGFFPGATAFSGPSTYLKNLNNNQIKEGQNVYTVWSKYDDLIQFDCVVWGKITCRIPGQRAEVQKTQIGFGHFSVRDQTGPDLIGWLQ